MKYAELKNSYDVLETKVLDALRNEVLKSKTESKHINSKVLKINVFDYKELALINNDNDLTFLDSNGYHYYIYSECSLEDLINILTKL